MKLAIFRTTFPARLTGNLIRLCLRFKSPTNQVGVDEDLSAPFYAPRIERIVRSANQVKIDDGVEFREGSSESWSVTHSQFFNCWEFFALYSSLIIHFSQDAKQFDDWQSLWRIPSGCFSLDHTLLILISTSHYIIVFVPFSASSYLCTYMSSYDIACAASYLPITIEASLIRSTDY